MEFEVSAKRHVVRQKAQQLENESFGKKVIDLSVKPMNDCNKWQIITASDPKAAEPIGEPDALEYDGAQLVQDIRQTLAQRGSMTIRGLS